MVIATSAAVMNDPRTATILDIFAKETNIPRDRLVPEATLEELGVASLDLVQTIFEIESRFDVEIPVVSERAGAEFSTVGELLTHVLRTLERSQPDHE